VSARTHLPSGLVTFLFTDIEGSTRLAQMLGTGYRPVLNEHRAVLRATLTANDGAELFTEGDSYFFAFSDAASALNSCLAAQRALSEHHWTVPQARPQVRMGLHTGYAEAYAGEYASAEVHRAQRVAAAAHGGQVLCSEATAEHAAVLPERAWLLDLGLHRLRGFDGRERLFQLVAPGLERQFPRPRTLDAASHNLPTAVTSFVGRERERAELRAMVEQHRLVTVVGAGGAGKTRLGVELAGELIPPLDDDTGGSAYSDGVWFVDLASVTDPGLVAFAVAAVLGLRPEPGRPIMDTLEEYAAGRRMLLVLDTCDAQLAAAVEVVSRLLSGGRGVKVLATSREPFGVPGEVVWRIPPLSLEPACDGGPSDAVALLLDRTAAARGGRRAEPAELPDLRRVARRLDGLPLAIELAAARLRVLSVSQLAERLDAELAGGGAWSAPVGHGAVGHGAVGHGAVGHGAVGHGAVGHGVVGRGGAGTVETRDMLGTLDSGQDETALVHPLRPVEVAPSPYPNGRHTTMQATVTWSYRTLGPRASRLLRWLAVFSGPVDLATVEWLLGDDPLDPLAVLVDKSLIQAEPTVAPPPTSASHQVPGTTYRMLDPIRAYAARRLVEAGEESDARDRHMAWCQHALQRIRLDAAGRPATLSIYALDPLATELRAALRWSATGGSARLGLQIAGGLDQWWRERGLAREGRLWLFRLYGRIAETGEAIPDAEMAVVYHMHSQHAGADGEFAEEMRFSQRAEVVARQAGNTGLLARVLAGRAAPLVDMGQPAEAERHCRDVIAWAAGHGVAADALAVVFSLAELLWLRGELDEAADLLAAARTAESSRPAGRGRRSVDMLLGMVALVRGDLVAAHDHLRVALYSRMRFGFHGRVCDTLNAMAVRCLLGDDLLTAARLFGAAQKNRSTLRSAPGIFGPYWIEQQFRVRAALGDATFDKAYAEGTALGLEEAAALALAVDHPDLAAGSTRFRDTVAGSEGGAEGAAPSAQTC
jgi:predicted ATPase/class 3 adenylate cyclase